MSAAPTSNVNCPVLAAGYILPGGAGGSSNADTTVGLNNAISGGDGSVQIYLDPAYGALAKSDIIIEITPDGGGFVDGTSFMQPEISNFVASAGNGSNFIVKFVNTKTASVVLNSGCGFWFKVSKLVKKV